MKVFNMISFSLLLSIIIACTKTVDATEADISSGVNKTELLQLVNDARKKGCQCGDTYYPSAPAVTWNEKLEKAALSHSNEMFRNDYFSHTDRSGNNAGVRIEAAGYRWKAYGENLAHGFMNEKEVVQGWLNSPGHCKNIMNKSFKEMGVAKAGNYWTQDFGSQ